MIDDLDRSIRNLLEREVPDLKENNHISFETPYGSDFAVPEPGVDLFLYDVRENLELRSNEWHTMRQNGAAEQERAPVRVDCSYLITAWAGDADSEHQLLGQVMKVLLRYPKLPEDVLHRSLKDQRLPLPATVLQPGRLQSVGEFWQALDGKPKAALHYTVTIGVQPYAPITTPLAVEATADVRPGVEENP